MFLGDFVFWDHERQTEFLVKEYGWKEDKVEGSYKWYKSVECRMAGVHDYAKYIKRGFGRGTDFASQDVRAGLMTREEAFELAAKVDAERPEALDYYLQITGYTEEEFYRILKEKRPGQGKECTRLKSTSAARDRISARSRRQPRVRRSTGARRQRLSELTATGSWPAQHGRGHGRPTTCAACIDRIAQFDAHCMLGAASIAERALERARKIDAELTGDAARLRMTGVPVGVKDIFNTYDYPTGMGSAIMDGYTPGNDARVVSNVRLEGGIVMGKTVTAEFAVHHPGPTVNPYDLPLAGHIVERLGCGGRHAHGPCRAGQPDRRLDHPAGELLRRLRISSRHSG